MKYWRFDPSSCGFPAAALPLTPPFQVKLARNRRCQRADAAQPATFFMQARYALMEAFRLAGLGPERGLLAPAYHCRTMLDPALAMAAPIALYNLDNRLAPDLSSLTRLWDTQPDRFGALLLPHYFGFAQDLPALLAWCEARGVALIEDCSHRLLNLGASAVGRTGRWSVSSPYKFVGCVEGGLLWPAPELKLRADRRREWRALLSQLRPATLGHWHDPSVAGEACGIDLVVADSRLSSLFDDRRAGQRGAPWARWILAHADLDDIAAQRRKRYGQLLEASRALPHCRPLYDDLPDDVVPYVFPLLLDRPDPHFFRLKRAGTQLGRWDDLAISDCPVSREFRLRLVQIPCHQGLGDAQMNQQLRLLQQVLGGAS